MQAGEVLRRLGGVATTSELLSHLDRASLEEAVAAGTIARATRGRYHLPEVGQHRHLAAAQGATLSHLSAAQQRGWPVLDPPDAAWLTVPRNRRMDRATQAVVHAVWADLAVEERSAGLTSPLRTVLDCARRLSFAEALAVADSALRLGAVTTDELRAAARGARGPGASQVRRVAASADPRAANPFESALRALVLQVPGFDVDPQLAVPTRGRTYHPDLVDVGRRVVIEADSWGFHADQQTHARDCVRYNAMVVAGWTVLRFTWEHVVTSPTYVMAVLGDLAGAVGAI